MGERFRRYYEPTTRELDWGLSVRGVGTYEADTGDIDAAGRWFPYFIIVLIVSGGGTFWWNAGEAERIGAGAVIRVAPDVWHRYQPEKGRGWKQYWVVFDGEYAAGLYERGLFGPPRSVIQAGEDDTLRHAMEHLVDTARMNAPGAAGELRLGLLRVIQRTVQLARHEELGSRLPMVRAATDHIERTWRQRLDVSALAGELGVSDSHLRRIFRQDTGMSPTEYQQSIRINEAKILLEQGRMSVQEVARAVGIDDQYYFSRLFKARTGVAPSLWRGV